MLSNHGIVNEIDKRNPSVCRFTIKQTLHVGPISFDDKTKSDGNPLAEAIFEIRGILKIAMIGHLLIVTKRDDANWSEIVPRVEAILSSYLVSGLGLTSDQVLDRMQLVGRSPQAKIEYLLDRQINPGVAAHAGFVELLEVRDDVAYIRMGGGCQGCGAADFTLRHSVEEIILKEAPEIRGVVDVTDHAAGVTPYFRRS
jgi:Fe-S cluster biogenesis protein NfuA